MIITNIEVDGFRNINDLAFQPDPGVNVICGSNAQGKTNLLEAIWLASGEKSFRGARDREMVSLDLEDTSVRIDFKTSERMQNVSYSFSRNPKDKEVLVNDIKARTSADVLGRLLLVIFTPDDLNLTKGSPAVRRDFLDMCVSQVRPRFKTMIDEYNNILEQRNNLLKSMSMGRGSEDELDVWDFQLAGRGACISLFRYTYIDGLAREAAKYYDIISEGKESLEIKYISTIYENLRKSILSKTNLKSEYYQMLKKNRPEDIRLGYTANGIHRDEVCVNINGFPVKQYGSQGQNRSAALCIKFGQAMMLKTETGEEPVILLDDVLSELDRDRQKFVLSNIVNLQTFITCCKGEIKKMGSIYEMADGKLDLVDIYSSNPFEKRGEK